MGRKLVVTPRLHGLEGTTISLVEESTFPARLRATEVAAMIVGFAEGAGVDSIEINSIGVGAGVVDMVSAIVPDSILVIAINPALKDG